MESEKRTYVAIVEPANGSFVAYVPDIPGCVATGSSRALVREHIQVALEVHLENLAANGESIPPPTSASIEITPRL